MFPLEPSLELSFQVTDKGMGQSDPKPENKPFVFGFSSNCVGRNDSLVINGHQSTNTANSISTLQSRRCSDHNGHRHHAVCSGTGGRSNQNRRIIRREVERQRRQEMAALYTSLRALLPTHCVKGKRSISDHIMEAANYIKDLHRRVKELECKREKLKGSSFSKEDILRHRNEVSQGDQKLSISVERCSQGLEIKISFEEGDGEEPVPLSCLINVLIEEGLNVVSCVSTKVKHLRIHVIHSELDDMLSIDPSSVKRKLLAKICSHTGSVHLQECIFELQESYSNSSSAHH